MLLSLFLVMGCAKNEPADPISIQSNILVKNASSAGKWKLSVLKIGTAVQSLTGSQLTYTKQYTVDSKFSDTDGFVGTWYMPTANTMVEEFTNFSSGVFATQTYKINSISDSQLNLTYTVNGTEINAIYTATK